MIEPKENDAERRTDKVRRMVRLAIDASTDDLSTEVFIRLNQGAPSLCTPTWRPLIDATKITVDNQATA